MVRYIKKNLLLIITLIISIGIMTVFVIYTNGFSSLISIMKKADYLWIVLAVCGMLLYWFMEGCILQNYLARSIKGHKLINSVYYAVIGLFYSALTPFSTGGQPMQVYEMKKKGMNTAIGCSALLYKTLVHQISIAIYSVAAFALYFSFFSQNVKGAMSVSLISLGLNALYITIMLIAAFNENTTEKLVIITVNVLSFLHIIKNEESTCRKLDEKVMVFHNDAKGFISDYKANISAMLLNAVGYLGYLSVPYCIYRGFNLSGAQYFKMVCAMAFVIMISAVVPLPGGAGAAEGSFILFFGLFFTDSFVFSAILLWRLFTYYSIILIGSGCLIYSKIKEKKKLLSGCTFIDKT